MIGGGQGAFIGAVHRIASRIDDRYELLEDKQPAKSSYLSSILEAIR
jgi:hypothetical protein